MLARIGDVGCCLQKRPGMLALMRCGPQQRQSGKRRPGGGFSFGQGKSGDLVIATPKQLVPEGVFRERGLYVDFALLFFATGAPGDLPAARLLDELA